ncbi:lipopolysaccharide biosynthesis protein [Mesorhizobium sp. YIM 152430]|uniref:lipopolysaccharide biosynthesis protein n=1 Tax=Mesorhizobium sp. YIM 152430 TaxID=3031761 RepID=UPI0023DC8883|nr:lipopolysaccharide biosynthesis protein [Mesorhizobium sp. YIM 152430]MDF1600803.1 lipopolysaccharide biosynthesis protein [Mesorhizobium sp. YIM 152430]
MAPVISFRTVTNNVGWSILSKTSTFGLKFVTVPILARLLSPEEFGIVAVAQLVVLFLTMVGGAGLAAALVVERTHDEKTVHSVFCTNFAMAIVMALALFVFAEPLATMMGAPGGGVVVQVMALIIPILLCGDVAYALLARRMAFDKDAFWSVLSESAGALCAVALALTGWGLWALVAQLFLSAFLRLGGLFYATGYRPRFMFSFARVRALWRYSASLMGSEIFNFITFQSPLVIVSRFLGIAEAGAYSAANRFASIPNQVVLAALMGVLFPTFSHIADDRERRTRALFLSTQVCSLVLAPMMFGIWAIAEPGMYVIFGRQWAWAWPVLGLLALSKGILAPCSTYIPYLKGVGKSHVLWWVAVARAVLVSAAVAYGAISGGLVQAMIWLCISNAATLVFYCWTVFRTDEIPFLRNFLVTCRPMASAFAMAVAVRFLVDELRESDFGPVAQIAIGGAAGSMLYATLILLTERALLRDLFGMVAKFRNRAQPGPAS